MTSVTVLCSCCLCTGSVLQQRQSGLKTEGCGSENWGVIGPKSSTKGGA